MVAILHSTTSLLLILAAASKGVSSDLVEMTDAYQVDKAAELLEQANKVRAAYNLPPLCLSEKLQSAAQRHVNDQKHSDYMSHNGKDDSTPQSRVVNTGLKCQDVSENIDSGNKNAKDVVNWWMRSEGREKILGAYTMTGTAYAYNATLQSEHFWVQVYATCKNEDCDK